MSKRILLCDDEIHILRAAEFKFKRAGYDVRSPATAKRRGRRSNAIARHPDYRLPDAADGRLWRWSRGSAATPPRPTCRSSCSPPRASNFRMEFTEKWNVLAVIAKPFSPRELLRRSDAVLREGNRTANK